ncbi:HNH endonuclease signature motif containing protein [Aeromonas media]|uniref:HNH endonuclease signature motif containing protein n=1 Tax=Aeromonas media TaxID=651 RepID=UPI0029DE53E8|nr:HNH endonuclease signature motif containing protein [Aeromonas media]
MSVSMKTIKQLCGKAANRCAFKDCRIELIIDGHDTDASSVVGEVCHIVSRSKNGPRGDSDLDESLKDEYENLILLCRVHHKEIDDGINFYTVEKLNSIKREHELWVKESLSENKEKSDGYILLELFYNAFWLLEHSNSIRVDINAYSIKYRNYIYQRLNRCAVALKTLDSCSSQSELCIDLLRKEFNKSTCEYEDFSVIHGLAHRFILNIKKEFNSASDKLVIAMSRSFVNVFMDIAKERSKIDCSELLACIEEYFGFLDQKLNEILMVDKLDTLTEGKVLRRLELIM